MNIEIQEQVYWNITKSSGQLFCFLFSAVRMTAPDSVGVAMPTRMVPSTASMRKGGRRALNIFNMKALSIKGGAFCMGRRNMFCPSERGQIDKDAIENNQKHSRYGSTDKHFSNGHFHDRP